MWGEGVCPVGGTVLVLSAGWRRVTGGSSSPGVSSSPGAATPPLTALPAGSRALKTRGNTPKYGLIFHSTFIGRAAAKNKGRISRYLANKCTIASRIDCFSGARGDGAGRGDTGMGSWAASAVMGIFFVNSISLV